MRKFAPADIPLGLHWHPYGDNVLPPVLDLPDLQTSAGEHIVVYLPFENQDEITGTLQQFPQQRFVQYAAGLERADRGNVQRFPASVQGFKRHLASSAGVVCNSGFELISECLQWGKPVLTKPVQGQMEQQSNALVLGQLGYATTTAQFDSAALGDWLAGERNMPPVSFPDVAEYLARWLVTGCHASPASLAQQLWSTRPGLPAQPAATGNRGPRLPAAA